MKLNKNNILTAILLCVIAGSSCANYSFNGASIDYNQVKTLSIANFYNDSGGGPPNIEQTFTESLKDYFQRNTKLELIQSNGDLQFEGAISSYEVRPQAIISSGDDNQNDQSGLMRLSIAIETAYVNTKKEEEGFQKNFSFYADYDPQKQTFTQVESELIEEIFNQIIQDIFLASVATW